MRTSGLKILTGATVLVASTAALVFVVACGTATNPVATNVPTPIATATSTPLSRADVIQLGIASVVRVETTSRLGDASGSGFIPSGIPGVVITAYHVVLDADNIFIRRGGADESVKLIADLIAFDEFADIAVLRTVDLGGGIPISERPPETGEQVIAVGFPLGLEGDVSVSQGIVSRSLEVEGKYFVQHDAEILRGNSGGPLISEAGEVLGINIAVLADIDTVAGLNFATQAGEIVRVLRSAGLAQGISIALPTATPVPTATPTATPTNTPTPTPLPTPSPTMTVDEIASVSATATRVSANATATWEARTETVIAQVTADARNAVTATAQARAASAAALWATVTATARARATSTATIPHRFSVAATATAAAVISYCDSRPSVVLHSSSNGSIAGVEGGFIGVTFPQDHATAVNFDASVTFFNATRYSWSYGLMFRQDSRSDADIVVLSANDAGGHFWAHYFLRPGDDWTQLQQRSLFSGGNWQPRDANTLRLVVEGRQGFFSLNGRNLGTLTLDAPTSDHTGLEPIYGFFNDDPTGTVSYENFIVTCPE